MVLSFAKYTFYTFCYITLLLTMINLEIYFLYLINILQTTGDNRVPQLLLRYYTLCSSSHHAILDYFNQKLEKLHVATFLKRIYDCFVTYFGTDYILSLIHI